MTRAVFRLAARFAKDDRGAFAVIFAIIAVVLLAMSGATVDFTSVQQARTRAQVALDAAALALQPSIYVTPLSTAQTTIQTQAQALLLNRLKDASSTVWVDCATPTTPGPCAHVQVPTIDTVNGQLTLQAGLRVPMNFVNLVGISSMSPTIVSVATRKKLKLEVAMVLDNSGSMAYTMGYDDVEKTGATRMQTLQASANCAANILYYGVASCSASTTGLTANSNVKMAVVPFTSAVNVGTGNATAAWLDRPTNNSNAASNPITLMHFDNDDYAGDTFSGPVDRVSLFSKVTYKGTALSWGGCVEARVNNGGTEQYDTDDTTPDTTQPDTLFTPYFAPDEPGGSSSGGTTTSSNSESFYNSYISDTPSVCNWSGTCATSSSSTAVETKNATGSKQRTTTTTVTNNKSKVLSTSTVKNGSATTVPATDTTTSSVTGTTATFTNSASGVSQSGTGICTCTSNAKTTTGSSSTAGPSTVTTVTVVSKTTSTSGSGNNAQTTTTEVDDTTTYTTTTITTPSTVNYSCTGQTYTPTGLDNQTLQQRLCKYNVSGGAVMSNATSGPWVFGPNGDCPAAPIQPLTTTPSLISTAVNAMTPSGATNIQEGAAWGFRVLSPTAPFTEGDAYDQATSKVMIVMTDGENTMYPSTGNFNDAEFYSAYGFPIDGRIGTATTNAATLEASVNTRLSTTCTNAKAAGITIYTIGVDAADTSNPTGNKALLTACASQTSFAYFPNTATDLQAAFVSIATQLAALRLAQ